MHACNIIAKHLEAVGLDRPTVFDSEKICSFTGETIKEGFTFDILSSNFTDWESLKFKSSYIGIDAAKCLKATLRVENGLTEIRKYSFFASESRLVRLGTDNMLEMLLSEKETPFVFCVGSLFSSKAQKHTSFKAEVNYNNNIFSIQTEIGPITFDKEKAIEVLPIVKSWYTVSKKEQTNFTKAEILEGCKDFKKIEAYGSEKYLDENRALEPVRKNFWFSLLVKAMPKQQNNQ